MVISDENSKSELEAVNLNWRKDYPKLLKERTGGDDYHAKKLLAENDEWNKRNSKLMKQLKKPPEEWELLLQQAMTAHPESSRLNAANAKWIEELRIHPMNVAKADNDWTWLSSVLSNPESFEKEKISSYANQNIAIYHQRIWSAANTAEKARSEAIKRIVSETGDLVSEEDIVVYFLG